MHGRTFRPPSQVVLKGWPRRCANSPRPGQTLPKEGLTVCDSTAEAKRYNGWANYETWAVALWIDNEQGSYNRRCDLAREASKQAKAGRSFTRKESAALILAELLKTWIDEDNPLSGDN